MKKTKRYTYSLKVRRYGIIQYASVPKTLSFLVASPNDPHLYHRYKSDAYFTYFSRTYTQYLIHDLPTNTHLTHRREKTLMSRHYFFSLPRARNMCICARGGYL